MLEGHYIPGKSEGGHLSDNSDRAWTYLPEANAVSEIVCLKAFQEDLEIEMITDGTVSQLPFVPPITYHDTNVCQIDLHVA